jgi:hypothetical protein
MESTMPQPRPPAAAQRLARHRRRLIGLGAQRLEITVPVTDAALVRALAATLRAGGEPAQQLRDRFQPVLRPPVAATGADLVAFFQASPLCDADLTIERDRASGRPVVL